MADTIDIAFEKLISKRGIYKEIGVTDNYIQQLRYKLKNGIGISMDTKLLLLQKSGWTQDDRMYNRNDLVSLLNFYKTTSQSAREMGPEYVVEKWEASRK